MPRDREEDSEHITSDRPTQSGQAPKAGGVAGGAGTSMGGDQGLSKTGTTPPAAGRTYTVKAGDSLSKIAKEVYGEAGKWKQIYEANKALIGSNPDLIKPGQVLTIP